MSLPTKLKTARLTDDSIGTTIDDKLGELEEAICDIFGITIDSNVAVSPFSINHTTGVCEFSAVPVGPASIDPTTDDQLTRKGYVDVAVAAAAVKPPIGAIIAWHKSFTNTPTLPDSWVECNGQVLSDAGSVYNGQTMPDLNGEGRFLRGAAISGTMQAEETKAHHHPILLSNPSLEPGTNGYYIVSNTGGDFVTGDASGTETRPINMSVVWVMRVK